MTPDTVIQPMVERIVRGFQPRRVILFGPHARGTATLKRDIDLLVVCDEVANKRTLAIAIGRTLSDLPVGKNIVVTTPQEINCLGHLVGTVFRPALVYERPWGSRSGGSMAPRT